MKKMMTIPKGSLLTITSGVYSDYSVRGVFRALKDIDGDALRGVWLRNHPEQAEEYRFKEDDFLAWLAREGYIEDVPSWEFHLSSYSSSSEMWISK